MNTQDTKLAANLDESLTHLAALLKKMGIEELNIEDDAQHHITNTDMDVDPQLVTDFCSCLNKLYARISTAA